ncbi:MAG: hypothetical protein QXD03_05955 [Candidatus Anstonellales archaeon]
MIVPRSTVEYGNRIRDYYKEHLREEIIASAKWAFRDWWQNFIAEKYMICDREGEHFFEPIRYEMSLHAYEEKPFYDETYIGVIIPEINSKLAVVKITQYKHSPMELEDEKRMKFKDGKYTPTYLDKKDILFNKPITIPRKTYEYFEKQLKEYVGIDIDTLKKVFFIISLFEPNIVGYYGEGKYEDIYKIFDKYFKDGDLKDSLKRLKYEFINIKGRSVWDDFNENLIAGEHFDLFGYGVKGIADVVFSKVREYTEKNLIVFDDNFLIDDYITIDELTRELEKRGMQRPSLDLAIYSKEVFEKKDVSLKGKKCPSCIPIYRWMKMKDGRVFKKRYWIEPDALTRRNITKYKYEEFGDILRLDADILLKDEKGKAVNPLVEDFLKEFEKEYPDIFKTLMPVGSVFTGLYKDIQDKFAVVLGDKQLIHFGVDKWYKGFKYDEKEKTLNIHSIISVYINIPSWNGKKCSKEKLYILHDRTDMSIRKNEKGEYEVSMETEVYTLTSKERMENALVGLAQHFGRLNKALEIAKRIINREDLHTILDLKRLTPEEAQKVLSSKEFDIECTSGECMKDLKVDRILGDRNMDKHLPRAFKKLSNFDFDKARTTWVYLKRNPNSDREYDSYRPFLYRYKPVKYNPISRYRIALGFTLRKEYNTEFLKNPRAVAKPGEDELSKPSMITVMEINYYNRYMDIDRRNIRSLTMNEIGEFINNMRNLADRIDINLKRDNVVSKLSDGKYVFNNFFMDFITKSAFFGFSVPLDSKKLLLDNRDYIEKLLKEENKQEEVYKNTHKDEDTPYELYIERLKRYFEKGNLDMPCRLYSEDMHKQFMKHFNDVLNEKNINNPLKEIIYRLYKDGIGVLYSALYPFMRKHIENVAKKSFEDGVDRKLTFATSSLATKKGVSRADEMLDAILITGDLLHSPASNVDKLVEDADQLRKIYEKNPSGMTPIQES